LTSTARKIVLPQFLLTELTEEHNEFAHQVDTTNGTKYFVQSKFRQIGANRRDGKSNLGPKQFILFPVVLHSDGTPWAEANLWILSIVENVSNPAMASLSCVAEDLAAFLRFIEEYRIDWLNFPSQKFQRPTYRFNGHLKHQIQNSELKQTTAKRRMSAVIRFYRWLIEDKIFIPENSPWKSSDRYLEFKGLYGNSISKKITTTDLSIRVVSQDDPYNEQIDDGGKLRPLPQIEQEWLLDALTTLGNTEMTLIHLFGLVTGARIQTILTFQIRHVQIQHCPDPSNCFRIPIGPGTGIDTKYDKKSVLHIPIWFYEKLQTYALSERAMKRRAKAFRGDSPDQYLFLSIRGVPLYNSRRELTERKTNLLRHKKCGQGVRQYITDYVLPLVQAKYDKKFHYRFHDTRATFGMNLVDSRLALVEKKLCTLKDVMNFVQNRMGHSSPITTERYLCYRSRLKIAHAVQDSWEIKLKQMTQIALDPNNDHI